MKALIFTLFPTVVFLQAFYSTCSDDVSRSCPNSDNQTDFLLSMKKGGTDILSTEPYMYDFMIC